MNYSDILVYCVVFFVNLGIYFFFWKLFFKKINKAKVELEIDIYNIQNSYYEMAARISFVENVMLECAANREMALASLKEQRDREHASLKRKHGNV